ncbi:hypothetical protein C3L33_01707, partial [Rhododendron williamsianum]
MLGLLLLAYVSQIVNEWHAIMKSLLRLSQPQDNSFKSGLKNAAKGLLIPFLPRRHCCSVVSPGLSPNLNTASSTNGEATLNGHSAGEGKQLKGIKLEPKSEMKKLRQLARASFAGVRNYEEGSTSYGL